VPTLIIATRNPHKMQEISALLAGGFHCLSLNDFPGAPPVSEDATTFAGNATKKAVELAQWLADFKLSTIRSDSCLFVLADDSGLEVDALNGAPGVRSARFAALNPGSGGKLSDNPGGNSSDSANKLKLLRLMEKVPLEKRTARFHCVLALTPVPGREPRNASPVCDANEAELHTELFDGTCEGRIAFVETGNEGFGYDPLFVPVGFEQSFGELGEPVKKKISHRAKALEKLRERWGV